MKAVFRRFSQVGVAALALVGSVSQARASGFAAARFGGEKGSVVATNPTALYYNPAGIGFSEGISLYGDGTLALRSATWQHPQGPNDVPEPTGFEGANYGKATLFNVFGGPMLGGTARLGDLALGGSLSVPFGGIAHWDENSKKFPDGKFAIPGAANDGVQRWHGIDGAIKVIYLTAGGAYRLGPLSLGASANLIVSSIVVNKAKNPTAGGGPDVQREGRADIDVSGLHGSFGLGAMLEAIPSKLWLGVSYQAQPGLGAMRLDGKANVKKSDGRTAYDVTFDQALPDVVRLGGRFRPVEDVELRLFGDMTRWSVMQSQCVAIKPSPCQVYADGADASPQQGVLANLKRNWNDTFGVRAGGSYWLQPEVELFVGAGFETKATPDQTVDPSLADSDTISGAFGGRFELAPKLYLGSTYTHLQMLERKVTTSKVAVNESTTSHPTLPNPTVQPSSGNGTYNQWIGILNVNVEYVF